VSVLPICPIKLGRTEYRR